MGAWWCFSYFMMVALTLFLWMLYDRCWNTNFQISVQVRVLTSLVFPVGLFILAVMFIMMTIERIFSGFSFWYLRSVGKIGKF